MNKEIKNHLKKGCILAFILPNDKYKHILREIIKSAQGVYEKICYVSLNKPCTTIKNELEEYGIDCKKFTFIDCVTASVKSAGLKNDTIFVSSPKALTELNIAIKKIYKHFNVDCVIFDSLSTLLIYEPPSTVIKFVHSLVSMFRVNDMACIFTVLKNEVGENVIKDLSMFLDEVVSLGE